MHGRIETEEFSILAIICLGTQLDENTSIQPWMDILHTPQEWWGIGSDKVLLTYHFYFPHEHMFYFFLHMQLSFDMSKRNSTRAAFKHNENIELLCIDELTPQWLLRKLKCLTYDQQITERKQQTGILLIGISLSLFLIILLWAKTKN